MMERRRLVQIMGLGIGALVAGLGISEAEAAATAQYPIPITLTGTIVYQKSLKGYVVQQTGLPGSKGTYFIKNPKPAVLKPLLGKTVTIKGVLTRDAYFLTIQTINGNPY